MSLFFLCARECIECDVSTENLPLCIRQEIKNAVEKYKMEETLEVSSSTFHKYNGKIFGERIDVSRLSYPARDNRYEKHTYIIRYRRGRPENAYRILFDGETYRVRPLGDRTRVIKLHPMGKRFFSMMVSENLEWAQYPFITAYHYFAQSHFMLAIEKNHITYKMNGIYRTYIRGILRRYSTDDMHLLYNKHGQLVESRKRANNRIYIVRYHGNSRLHMNCSFEDDRAYDVIFQTYNPKGEPENPTVYMVVREPILLNHHLAFSIYDSDREEWRGARRFP